MPDDWGFDVSLYPKLTKLDRKVIDAIPVKQWVTLAEVAQSAGMGRSLNEIAEVQEVLAGCAGLHLVLDGGTWGGRRGKWACTHLGRLAAEKSQDPLDDAEPRNAPVRRSEAAA